MNDQDILFMKEALIEANKAFAIGEVPVGCVVVKDGKILSRGYNRRETDQHVFRHAEMIAMDEACKILGSWRLDDCTLYVTLEPCVMCSGAMIQARIARCVYGALEPKSGAHQSVINVFHPEYNHQVEVEPGCLAEESGRLLKTFFKQLRQVK